MSSPSLPNQISAGRAALSGAIAALVALGVGELAGAFFAPSPGPVVAVATKVIDHAPAWFVSFGKAVFGLADKPALIVGTVVLSVAIAALVGLTSRRSLRPAFIGFGFFGLLGFLSIGTDPRGSWIAAAVASIAAALAGLFGLRFLLSRSHGRSGAGPAIDSPTNPAVSRRSFLGWASLGGAAAVAAGASGRSLRSRTAASGARELVDLGAAEASAEVEQAVAASVTGPVGSTPGIAPLITPNDEFYLIDTALLRPQVDPATWQLRVHGMVDQELTITYDELLERAQTVAPVTLSCVSNEVGGDLVGTAVWQGVPLAEILDEAGLDPQATQIASRSVDGWECGFPTEAAFDGRTALIAIAMNDEPLPINHGFPARLVVSGLYGYVSATKWLSEIEATTLEGFDGYWIPRGWSKLGPIKTQSRIDTPHEGQAVTAGTVAVGGVAWAPNTGIERVEVRVDEGDWSEAALGESLGKDSWTQWRWEWDAAPGDYRLQVRATDRSGYTQTPDLAPPAPNGATGWHTVFITVA